MSLFPINDFDRNILYTSYHILISRVKDKDGGRRQLFAVFGKNPQTLRRNFGKSFQR